MLPTVVMTTPAMLTTTATTLTVVKDCLCKHVSSMSVNRPEVENSMVVVATLVLANAAFVKYCKNYKVLFTIWSVTNAVNLNTTKVKKIVNEVSKVLK